jgi:hypothetical protein
MRTARIVRGHAPKRAGTPASGIWRKEQTVWSQCVLKIGEDDPRLHDGLQVGPIDLEDLAHPRERDDDPAARGDRAAGLARACPARHDRRAGRVGEAHDTRDLSRRTWHDDDVRQTLLSQ